jgi:GntR family transcriptional regulator, carbon starvation induced regulator
MAGRGSSVDRVHSAVRELILSGKYEPGSRLILSRLANEHGVSFIPVREALRRLEAEKMVRVERNRGATVTELSIEDMRDIYETRLVLEEHALRAAIALGEPEQMERSRSALKAMAERFDRGEERAAYAHHEEFHLSLYEAGGSMWTVHLVRQLWSSAERYVRLAASVRPDAKLFVAEHEEIFAAVEARDADLAAEKLAENLRTTERLLTETYEPGLLLDPRREPTSTRGGHG